MKHRRILPAMRRSAMQAGLLLIALLGAATIGLPSLRGATITVTEVADGLGLPNLRQALADANDGDTIEFDPLIGGRNLPLAPVFGELVVDKSVTISWIPTYGNPSYLGVDAGHACRVFHISPGKTVTISGLGIVNGSAPAPNRFGAGIYNDHATLTLNSCTITGNLADQGTGGGIYNDGSGGTATMTITNCTISGNSAWPGAGICNDGIMTIVNTTISGNSDNGYNFGGGILNFGPLTITNSTLSGNSAYAGGAIYNWQGSTLTLSNNTFSGNFCNANFHGGGIYNEGGTLTVANTIFKAGPSGENIYHVDQTGGGVTSLGYNLSSDNGGGYLTATGDRINTDPKLGPLQNNGGPTLTHLPALDSPAIDGSDPAVGMDQRGAGFVRVVNGRADIGAVEVQATSTPAPTPTPKPHGKPH